jgi:hypothetical protein
MRTNLFTSGHNISFLTKKGLKGKKALIIFEEGNPTYS